MAFQLTAPQVTSEEERIERENLSQEECKQLDVDIFGTPDVIEETDDMKQTGLRMLQEALDTMEVNDKSEYMEALERCPDVVEKEVNYVAFLRAEKYNSSAAARRIASYWKMRKKIFGVDAYMPMTQTGAMAKSLKTLEKGLVRANSYDQHGRLVLHLHRTEMYSEPRNEILQASFYVLHVSTMTEEALAPSNGLVMIATMKCFHLYRDWDRILTKFMGAIILQSMPVQLKCAHACFASGGPSVADIIYPFIKQILGRVFRLRLFIHAGSDAELHDKLRPFGIIPEKNLPECLGGGATLVDFQQWLRQRRAVEENTTSYIPVKDNDQK